jgi:hypothetical protein
MAIVGAIAAVAGAGAAVVGTVQAGKAQKRAAAEQQKQQELVAARDRRQAIREAQIRRAQGLASAQAMGVSGGSLTGGGSSSIGSQLGSTLGFSSQMSGLSTNITRLSSKASMFGDIAGLAGMGFNALGGWDQVKGMVSK